MLGAVYALLVGIPLMRLSGIAAGISTLAVLGITYNILTYWTSIGPGPHGPVPDPHHDRLPAGDRGRGRSHLHRVRLSAQPLRRASCAPPVRIPPPPGRPASTSTDSGCSAFTLSGALSGFAGGLYVHLLGSIATNQVYLDLTFLTLAMLVVGGISSLFGAVSAQSALSLFTILLGNSSSASTSSGWRIKSPAGTSLVGVAIVMLVILLLRPDRDHRWARVPLFSQSLRGSRAGAP